MNHIFRVVWSTVLGRLVVTSEHAVSRRSTSKCRVAAVGIYLPLLCGMPDSSSAYEAGGGDDCNGSPTRIAIGSSATGCNDNAIAIGSGSGASGGSAISLGVNTRSTGSFSLAIGSGTQATADNAFAFGSGSMASAANTVAIGRLASASVRGGSALGDRANASGVMALSLGSYSQATADRSIGLGYSSNASGPDSFAAGNNAAASGSQSIALGTNSAATFNGDIALGDGAMASGSDNYSAISIGRASSAVGMDAIAYGNSANASADYAMAVGNLSAASGEASSAFGTGSNASGSYSLAAGSNSEATSHLSTAVGNNALVIGEGSSAFGHGATVGMRDGDGNDTAADFALAVGSNASATAADASAVGNNATASGEGSSAFGSESRASQVSTTAMGSGARARAVGSSAFGSGAVADGENSLAIGGSSSSQGARSIAVGYGSIATAADAISLGYFSIVAGQGSLSIGTGNQVIGERSGAIGDPSYVTGNGTYTLGNDNGSPSAAIAADNAGIFGNGNFLGDNATGSRIIGNSNGTEDTPINVADAFILGNNASVTVANSVVLGSNSIANGNTLGDSPFQPLDAAGNTIEVAGTAPVGEVSVGAADSERRITNVAAGSADTDAVNVSQLSAVNEKADYASQGFNLGVNGSSTSNVAPGEAVRFLDGANIELTQDGANITIATAPDISIDSLSINGGGPSIDASGIDMGGNTITALGDGAVNADSTDAINGSQLFRQASNLGNIIGGNTTINPDSGEISTSNLGGTGEDTINGAIGAINTAANAGWNLSDAEGNTANIGPNGGVTFSGDDNLEVTQTGEDDRGQVAIRLNRNLDLNSVTTGNSRLDDAGLEVTAISDSGDVTSTTVVTGAGVNVSGGEGRGGSALTQTGLTVASAEVDGEGNPLSAVTVAADGIDMGGSTITALRDGAVNANSTEAINGSQLFRHAANVGDIIGGNTTIDPNTGEIITSNLGGTGEDTIDAALAKTSNAANAGWNVTDDYGNAANIGPNGSVAFTGDNNLSVEQVGDDNDGQVAIRLNRNLELDSVTLPGGLSINADGIDMNGQTISNLGDPTARGDAVNLAYFDRNRTRYYSVNDGGEEGGNYDNNGATGRGAIAVGVDAQARAENAIAIGRGATVGTSNGIALGADSISEEAIATEGSMIAGQMYTYAGSAPVGNVSLGSAGKERTLTNIAAGRVTSESTDAVNGSQLYATNQAVAAVQDDVFRAQTDITALDGRVTSVEGNITNLSGDIERLGDQAVQYSTNEDGSVDYSSVELKGEGGTTIGNLAAGDIAENSREAVNGSQLWEMQNAITDINQGGSRYFRANADGPAAQANGANSVASGPNSVANGDNSVAMGNGAVAEAEGSIALGAGSRATRAGMNGAEEAFSGHSVASTQGAVSVGSENKERQITNVAGGTEATDAVNVRQLSSVQAGAVNYDRHVDGSVNYSSVTMGQAGSPTRVHNVASGEADTDAANVGQLRAMDQNYRRQIDGLGRKIDDVKDQANAGTASALAAAAIPQATIAGKSMIAVGGGTYQGESAVAVGFSWLSDNGRWTTRLNLTGDTQNHAGAAVGVGFHW